MSTCPCHTIARFCVAWESTLARGLPLPNTPEFARKLTLSPPFHFIDKTLSAMIQAIHLQTSGGTGVVFQAPAYTSQPRLHCRHSMIHQQSFTPMFGRFDENPGPGIPRRVAGGLS